MDNLKFSIQLADALSRCSSHPFALRMTRVSTVEPLLTATLAIMATHLGPHCIEIVLVKFLTYDHSSVMDEIFGPNGGQYRGIPLYT